jgi:hypothetical protein
MNAKKFASLRQFYTGADKMAAGLIDRVLHQVKSSRHEVTPE